MQKFIPKVCFTILSVVFLSAIAVGAQINNNISYLDSVSSSYLYNQQDKGSKILHVDSDEAQSFEATFKLDNKPVFTKSNAKINLSLRDSDVRQVLRMLADKAGINIILHSSIEGKITLDLNNIDINDAFMVIFKLMQYAYTFEDNSLTVMKVSEYYNARYTRQNVTFLPVKYVNAESVAGFLNKNIFNASIFGLSARPVVSVNPGTNQLLVFGTNTDVAAIKRILPALDTKPLINNFRVSHTTPKEMANLICDSLFYQSGEDGGSKGKDDTELDKEELVLGGGVVACKDIVKKGEDGVDDLVGFNANSLSIAYFPDLGRISVIGGPVERVQMIGEFIKEHDKKQLMAYVELTIIELNETGSKEFSNEWNLWSPFISLNFSPGSGLGVGSLSPFFLWGHEFSQATTVKKWDSEAKTYYEEPATEKLTKTNNKVLTYKLKYLVENGNGRVLTNPKIMVTNGRKSTIDMTSDYVKSVTTQVLEGSSSLTSATQRQYEIGSDEGLKIELVPFISPDGYVSMNISPEFATVKERVYAANSQGDQELQATLLQRRDLELKNIRIRDGETLVLAGLIREQEQQTAQKMPLLSDLPFFGAFFRNSTNNKAREELVIVVTPHIVKDNDSLDGNVYDL